MSEFRKLADRVVNLLRSAVLHRVDDSTGVQLVQVTALEDEDDDAIPHAQPYGVSFVPPADAEGYIASVGSDVSNRVAFGLQKRDVRPKDHAEGEGGLYRLDGTWAVFVDEDGTVHFGKEDPADFVALASKVLDELKSVKDDITALANAVASHSHLVATTGSATAQTGSTTSTVFSAPTPHTPASVASEVLKAE